VANFFWSQTLAFENHNGAAIWVGRIIVFAYPDGLLERDYGEFIVVIELGWIASCVSVIDGAPASVCDSCPQVMRSAAPLTNQIGPFQALKFVRNHHCNSKASTPETREDSEWGFSFHREAG
jgi:hypothetical protein